MSAAALMPLAPDIYRELVRQALEEDLGPGDVTTKATVDPRQKGSATPLAKSRCVLAGLDVAAEAFRQIDRTVTVTVRHSDGSLLEPGTVAA